MLTVRVVDTKIGKWILTISLVTLLLGCSGSSELEFTDLPKWGGFETGAEYETRSPLYLLQVDLPVGKRYALSPDSMYDIDRYFNVPDKIENYQRGRGYGTESGRYYNSPTEVQAIIDSGAKLQCCKFVRRHSRSWFFGTKERVIVYGRLMYAEQEIDVDLSDLSIAQGEIVKPNNELLKEKA